MHFGFESDRTRWLNPPEIPAGLSLPRSMATVQSDSSGLTQEGKGPARAGVFRGRGPGGLLWASAGAYVYVRIRTCYIYIYVHVHVLAVHCHVLAWLIITRGGTLAYVLARAELFEIP